MTFLGGQPINVIGPIPQTMRAAFGASGAAAWAAPFAIFLLIARAVASASLIFTGLTRLPMTAGWDNLAPRWFSELHPRWRTPVHSILVMTALAMAFILLSMLGVREQEASQVLTAASVIHYAIAYIALFALPVVGRRALRSKLPLWLKIAASAGLLTSAVSLFIGVYPIVDVVSRAGYAVKICSVVAISNLVGLMIYRWGKRK